MLNICVDMKDAESEDEKRIMTFNTLHILSRNGWKWHTYITDWLIKMDDCEDYDQYTLTILGSIYHSTVRAVVASHSKHLNINGHYGVLWLDVAKYETEPPYSETALKDMITAIEYAEDNLLKIGMPFSPYYEFHGRNKANSKRRNDKLRKLYNLDELESEG